jgi:hypothetical protein
MIFLFMVSPLLFTSSRSCGSARNFLFNCGLQSSGDTDHFSVRCSQVAGGLPVAEPAGIDIIIDGDGAGTHAFRTGGKLGPAAGHMLLPDPPGIGAGIDPAGIKIDIIGADIDIIAG